MVADFKVELAERLLPEVRQDAAIYNIHTGLGLTDLTSGSYARQQPRVPDEEIQAFLSDTHLGHTICHRPARDSLQRWPWLRFGIDSEDAKAVAKATQKAAAIMDRVEGLGRNAATLAAAYARAFGGALVYVGARDGRRPEEPLNERTLSEVTHFTVFQPTELQVVGLYDDPLMPKYGQPSHYLLTRQLTSPSNLVLPRSARSVRGPVVIHESRMVRFGGQPTTRERFEQNLYWDDSVFQRLQEALKRCSLSWQSAANLLSKGNLLALRQKGYRHMVTSNKDEALARLSNQMAILKRGISSTGLIHMDLEDELINVAMSFGGVPELLDRVSTEISGATGMPVTILWGISPGGQNATGDSDWQNYERFICSVQELDLDAPLRRMAELVMLAKDSPTRGKLPERWWIEFQPLSQPSDRESAELRKLDAETFKLYIESEIVTPTEVALSVFSEQGYSRDIKVDMEARRAMAALEAERALLLEQDDVELPQNAESPELGTQASSEPDPAADDEG